MKRPSHLSELERELCERVETTKEDAVQLLRDLIRFDTTTALTGPDGAPTPNAEHACQEYLADFLRQCNATIDQWEPDRRELEKHPNYQSGQHWRGRPVTVATIKGAGGGRSLILNGHIDVAPASPMNEWHHAPFEADHVADRVHGRGACDMKAGITSMLTAARIIADSGIRLKGDLIIQTVPDEETTGLGTVAAIMRGYRADAALVPEPTKNEIWLANRGVTTGLMRVKGRAAHAELPQPHWSRGGGVNAIEKAAHVIRVLAELNNDWKDRPEYEHPYLAPPIVVSTMIHGGEFLATYPAACELSIDLSYLPIMADEDGFGNDVRREVEEVVRTGVSHDQWLEAHPPTIEWMHDFPPYEGDGRRDFYQLLKQTGANVGFPLEFGGMNCWHDGASLATLGAVSTAVALGPGDMGLAHTSQESVGIEEELIPVTKTMTGFVTRWCGVA